MKTISVKGVGKAKRDPDLAIFRISTTTQTEELKSSINESNRLINDLKEKFQSIGFEKDDLKTVSYYTRPVYETVEVGVINKRHKREFKSFEVEHDLKIEFDLDNERINKVIKCLNEYGEELDFRIEFSVKDKDAMKRDLLIDATKNARLNAEILCEASSLELGDLIKIEYSWANFNFTSRSDYGSFRDFEACLYDECTVDFTPDSIEISDDVAFIWQIR